MSRPFMSKVQQLSAAEKEVAAFNKRFKIGDEVIYTGYPGATPHRLTTRTEASVLSGHTAVVWLNGKSGCVAVSHCKEAA
jgi:hypothetical protein